MRVNIIASGGMRCGDADYIKLLAPELTQEIQVELIEIKDPETKNPLEFYRIAKNANRNCDIIHVQHEHGIFGKFVFSGTYAPVLYFFLDKNKKIITSLHDVVVYRHRSLTDFMKNLPGNLREYFIFKLTRSVMEYFIFKYSTLLHVHTENAKKILISKGVSENKIAVIPLGVFIKPEFLDKEESKATLNLKGKRIITIFGFVHRNKGHDLVIDILPKLDEDVVILISGDIKDPAYVGELKKKATKMGLEDRVIFLGYVNEKELPVIFSASDVIALPYRKITQSSVLNHALAYRVPTFTSDLPAFVEIKRKYDCIEIFKSEDKQDLELKLKKLLGDKEMAKELMENTKSYLKERGAENTVKKIIELYGEI